MPPHRPVSVRRLWPAAASCLGRVREVVQDVSRCEKGDDGGGGEGCGGEGGGEAGEVEQGGEEGERKEQGGVEAGFGGVGCVEGLD